MALEWKGNVMLIKIGLEYVNPAFVVKIKEENHWVVIFMVNASVMLPKRDGIDIDSVVNQINDALKNRKEELKKKG
jgi:hypothetical protein